MKLHIFKSTARYFNWICEFFSWLDEVTSLLKDFKAPSLLVSFSLHSRRSVFMVGGHSRGSGDPSPPSGVHGLSPSRRRGLSSPEAEAVGN